MSCWTEGPDGNVEMLKKLWEAGRSASQIAAELRGNVTRNAVIGKIHRLGLSGRAKSPSSAKSGQRKARPAQHMMRVARPAARGNSALASAFEYEPEPEPIAYDTVVPMSQRISLLELTVATCHWPIGDPQSSEFFFCGGKAIAGKLGSGEGASPIPYCAHHCRIAYRPAEDRRRRSHGSSLVRHILPEATAQTEVVTMLRKAKTTSTSKWNLGGREKTTHAPKKITLARSA